MREREWRWHVPPLHSSITMWMYDLSSYLVLRFKNPVGQFFLFFFPRLLEKESGRESGREGRSTLLCSSLLLHAHLDDVDDVGVAGEVAHDGDLAVDLLLVLHGADLQPADAFDRHLPPVTPARRAVGRCVCVRA